MNGTARVNVVSDQNRRTEIKAVVNIWRQVTRIRGPPMGDRSVGKAVYYSSQRKNEINTFLI